jgi:hypothetical protein
LPIVFWNVHPRKEKAASFAKKSELPGPQHFKSDALKKWVC